MKPVPMKPYIPSPMTHHPHANHPLPLLPLTWSLPKHSEQSVPALRIRIRGIRKISLDPDPYEKLDGSGIRIRIKIYGSVSN